MPLVASTDSHDCAAIGRYLRVRGSWPALSRGGAGMTDFLLGVKWLLVAFVMLGAVPLVVANYQFLLVGRALPAAALRPSARRTSRAPPS